MAEYPVRYPLKHAPSHPGGLMREIIVEHLRLSIAEAARRMRITRAALYAVLGGRSAVTAEMALRFCRLAGGTPDLFLRMQDSHALWRAERKLGATLKKIEPAKTAA